MKAVWSVPCIGILLIVAACGKEGDDNPNPPAPPTKKVILTKIITETGGFRGYRQFQYDNEGRLLKIIADSVTKPGHVDIEFSYDVNGRLIQSTDYGNANGPTEFVETRKYYYDAAGNMVGDSGFNKLGEHNWYWDNRYTYDAQNRILTMTTANGTVKRWDYGAGKNPLNLYVRYISTQELNIIKYDSFDSKKCIFFDDKTLNTYFRTYGFKYINDFFQNNPVRYKEARGVTSTTVLEYGDIIEEFQYNASNYPISRKVIETSIAGTLVMYEQWFEYEEK